MRKLFGKDPVERIFADQDRRLAMGAAIGELKIASTVYPEPLNIEEASSPEKTSEEKPQTTNLDATPNIPPQQIVINSNPVRPESLNNLD